MNAIAIGGAESLLAGAYGKKMAAHNVHILWHEVRPSRLEMLPEAAEGVIIIKDLVSHSLAGSAIALAKMKGIPFVQVTRKFSHAYPIMRDSGFLAEVKAAPPPPVTAVVPSEALSDKPSNRALSEPEPPILIETKETSMTNKQVHDELNEAMDLIFRDDPYCIKDPDEVGCRLFDLTGANPTREKVAQLCDERAKSLREMSGRIKEEGPRKYRDDIRKKWMLSFIREYSLEHDFYANYATMNEEAKKHLGSMLHHSILKEYMEEVEAARLADLEAKRKESLEALGRASQPPAWVLPVSTATTQAVPVPAAKVLPTRDLWADLTKAIEALTLRVDATETLLSTLLARQNAATDLNGQFSSALEKMQIQMTAVGLNVSDARTRIKELEEKPKSVTPTEPVVPTTFDPDFRFLGKATPPQPTLAQHLAELAGYGLCIKIEKA